MNTWKRFLKNQKWEQWLIVETLIFLIQHFLFSKLILESFFQKITLNSTSIIPQLQICFCLLTKNGSGPFNCFSFASGTMFCQQRALKRQCGRKGFCFQILPVASPVPFPEASHNVRKNYCVSQLTSVCLLSTLLQHHLTSEDVQVFYSLGNSMTSAGCTISLNCDTIQKH